MSEEALAMTEEFIQTTEGDGALKAYREELGLSTE